jgi:hypothetical protein
MVSSGLLRRVAPLNLLVFRAYESLEITLLSNSSHNFYFNLYKFRWVRVRLRFLEITLCQYTGKESVT